MFLVSEVTLQCREIHQMYKLGQAVMAWLFRLGTDRTACSVHATMACRFSGSRMSPQHVWVSRL